MYLFVSFMVKESVLVDLDGGVFFVVDVSEVEGLFFFRIFLIENGFLFMEKLVMFFCYYCFCEWNFRIVIFSWVLCEIECFWFVKEIIVCVFFKYNCVCF